MFAGYDPFVKAFSRDGSLLTTFFAFSTTTHGVNVGTGDYDADGMDEIVTTPGPGSSSAFAPNVRIWNYDGLHDPPLQMVSFYAFSSGFYGAFAAGGHILPYTGDQLLVTRGPDPVTYSNDRIKVFKFSGNTAVLTLMFGGGAVPLPLAYGAHAAVGAVTGEGYDDLVIGAGPDPDDGSTALVYKGGVDAPLGTPTFAWTYLFGSPTHTYGVRAGTANFDADARDEVIVGKGWTDDFPENSRVLAIDTPDCPSPPCTTATVVKDFTTFANTRYGVFLTKFWYPNVPVPFKGGSSGTENGIAASPVLTATQLASDVARLLVNADKTYFKDEGARQDLIAEMDALSQELARKNMAAALTRIADLKALAAATLSVESFGEEISSLLDLSTDRVKAELADVPPVAVIAGPSPSTCPGQYTFSASGTTDADKRGLARDDIQNLEWRLDGKLVAEGYDQSFASIGIPPGPHTVEVRAVDTFGKSGTASYVVSGVDGAAPTGHVDLVVSRPDGDGWYDIAATPRLTDSCDPEPSSKLIGVEGADKCAVEVKDADFGTSDFSFRVRGCAEIVVTFSATDLSGNVGTVNGDIALLPTTTKWSTR